MYRMSHPHDLYHRNREAHVCKSTAMQGAAQVGCFVLLEWPQRPVVTTHPALVSSLVSPGLWKSAVEAAVSNAHS